MKTTKIATHKVTIFVEVSALQQRSQLCQDLVYRSLRQWANQFSRPCAPIQAFDLVGQYRARSRQATRDQHLERVTLDLVRDWAEYSQPNLPVICGGR